MLDLDDIRAFTAVADAGGFGAAGRRLNLSTSIVSRRLARLEGELNARLLTRTTRGVALTEAGHSFLPYAEHALADLEAGRDAVACEGQALTGALRLAAPLSFGATHLAPVLAEFAQVHPRLTLETDYSDRMVNLIAERFDAAIRIGVLTDSSLIARKIADIHVAIVAAPSYLAEKGTPRSLADLEGRDAVGQPGEVWKLREGNGREVTVRPTMRLRANSGPAIAAAAQAGLGIAALPTFLVGEAIGAGTLVRLLPQVRFPEAGLFLVRPPPAGPAPAKIRALTDLLLERFGGEPVWDACAMAARAGA